MAEEVSSRSAGHPRHGRGEVTYLEQALWQQLAAAETDPEFCWSWLELQCRIVGQVSGGVVVLASSEEGSFAPAAFWPEGLRGSRGLMAVTEQALRERKGVVTRTDTLGEDASASPEELRFLLAYPVWVDGELQGVAALELTPRPQTELQSAMRQLQWGIAWLCHWVLRKRAEPQARVRLRLAQALDLMALTLQHEHFRDAATALATELATRLQCDRVSVGWIHRGFTRLVALSHSADFHKQMKLVQAIGAAMDEAGDQQATIVLPVPSQGERRVVRAHEALVRDHGGGAVCTVPLLDGAGEPRGALTLERPAAKPFDPDTVLLCESVSALVGPILEEKRRNSRVLVGKVWDSASRSLGLLVGPRHVGWKLSAGAALAMGLFFSLTPGDYRVTARASVEGAVQRIAAAPFEGFIQTASVRPGDVVRQGQELCQLDDRDLRLERLRWAAERQQRQFEYRKAVAEADRAQVRILQEQIGQAEAQLALIDAHLERARVTAPFDGVVISGDLSQSLGAPVQRGDVLFEVAPLDAFRVVFFVDERYIRDVRAQQRGELILAALPGVRMPFTIRKVTPASEPREGRTCFRVEAELDELVPQMRPGMEGFGKIVVDRRKLFWIWTHDLRENLRLRLWSWWP